MTTGLLGAFKEENKRQKLRQSRIGCMLTLFIVPMGIGLDYFVYPELLASLATIRILCSIAVIPVLALHHTAFGKANASILPFTWPMIINIAMCFMVYLTGGSASLYYAGLNIVLICIIFILPLSIMESLIFSIITLVLYIATCSIAADVAENFNVFYSNLNFLTLTAAVSCLVSHINSKNSFQQFRLSYELDIKNQQLTNLERLRTSFFANISHELRTPLTLILSPVQDLLADNSHMPPKVMQILQTTYTNGLRLLKLVNELLEVIRIEEGKSQLNLKPLFIDDFLNELVDSLADLSDKKRIDIEKQFECASAQILCDMHAFERIIINLVHNAIKFSDAESQITISTSHDGATICIVIADTGIGISEEELPFIFERFRQADSSTTRQYQGSGLGLSLVKDLTEQLDGTVEVRSQLGVGTKFKLTFPVYRIISDKQPVAAEEEQDALQKLYRLANRSGMLHLENSHQGAIQHAPAQTSTPKSAHTVLVVEDEFDLREYLVAALSDSYPILQAVDGEQALVTIREQIPSLIVLDLMLPKIDGLDLCARIKQDKAYRHIKVILLTARIDEDAKITALNNGADDFLTKPFSTLELQTRIRNLLHTTDFERQLVDMNQDLKQTLQELKGTQAQLIQSEKTHALEYLSAGILHEINNPLNYTLTALQLARGLPATKNDAMLPEIFDDMHEGMTRIKGIVGDLQAFAHSSPVDKQASFKLAHAVRTALTFTSKDVGSTRIVDETDKEVQVIGSRNHVVQVLINLITNALKAVRAVEAQRKGEILLRSVLRDDNRLVVTVRDNGTGIDQEILGKIFDPFFTTRDVGEGMGLGLAVSQTIVKAHGGQLQARSVQGEWTEFSFDLPADVKGP